MVNCGMTHLRLVAPRDGWPDPQADDLSAGAVDLLDRIEIFDTLEEAIADCHYVLATTARRREITKPVFTARQAAQNVCKDSQNTNNADRRTAFLFGPERTGLINDDIARCSAIINIPLNPDFSSLNLAQAVLLVCYEYAQIRDDEKIMTNQSHFERDNAVALASQKEIDEYILRLFDEIEDGNFFRNPDVRPHMERNLRSFVTRALPTAQEIKTLHGVITALIGRKTKIKNYED